MKRDARIGVPAYTYRQNKSEDQLIYKKLAVISGITLVILLIIWFWGVFFLQLIGGLWSTPSEDVENNNITLPLLKPNLASLPEVTNKAKINISGTTTSGTEVTLFLNGLEADKTSADASGSFVFEGTTLKEGLNLIKVVVTNEAGETAEDKTTVTLDKTPPKLVVSKPTDGQQFEAKTTKITINGTSEPQTTVLVNAIQAPVNADGSFTYTLTVRSGENKITIKATDEAGNSKSIELTVKIQD